MDATITNDTGTVIHSYNSLSKEGCTQDCSTGGPTELELDIDMETMEYGIRLPVQGCYGIPLCKGQSNKFALTDETATDRGSDGKKPVFRIRNNYTDIQCKRIYNHN